MCYKMKLKPLFDNVLVLPKEADQRTAAGLILPETAQESPLIGTVIAVGGGTPDCAMEVAVGDMVIYAKYVGSDVDVEGVRHIILNQRSILAVIEEERR